MFGFCPVNIPIWDDLEPQPGPRLEGTQRADVCVVGLGGSGLTVLEELAGRGLAVAGIDAASIGGGAAGRNGGFLLAGLGKFYHRTVVRYGREIAAALYRETLEEITRQEAGLPGVVRRTGAVRIAADEAEFADCQAQATALRADGFAVEDYRGPEGEGILLPDDGVMQPLRRVRAMAARLQDQGVRLYQDSPVWKVDVGEVATEHGTIRCDTVIVAVDGKLEQMFPELGRRLRTGRLQMLATAPAPEVAFTRPVYRRFGQEYWQQRPDGSIVLGGLRDDVQALEWTSASDPTRELQELLDRYLREHLKVRAPVTHRWAASVAYAADSLPVIERIRNKTWVVGAYSGSGNIVGALSARAIAQMALGQPSQWAGLVERARFAPGTSTAWL